MIFTLDFIFFVLGALKAEKGSRDLWALRICVDPPATLVGEDWLGAMQREECA